ncbi:MAG: response regulator transcription factor [Cyanobacteria bacterium J06560_2]
MTSSPQTFLIVDAHEVVLRGTRQALATAYPEAKLTTANTAKQALSQLKLNRPQLLVTDLLIPQDTQDSVKIATGIAFLRQVMAAYPSLNILVQSSHVRSLIRLKPSIHIHWAGFTIVDKKLPITDMLEKADWSLRGISYTPAGMRAKLELRPEWLQLLQLAFTQGLQDRTIAKQMNIAERTVRRYWASVQAALNVSPAPGTNIRIQTGIYARAAGLID